MIKRNLVIGLSFVWKGFKWLFCNFIPELIEDIDDKYVSPMIKKWSSSEAEV